MVPYFCLEGKEKRDVKLIRRLWSPLPEVLNHYVHMGPSDAFLLESKNFFLDWTDVFYDLVLFRKWYEEKIGVFPEGNFVARFPETLYQSFGRQAHLLDFAAKEIANHPGICCQWRYRGYGSGVELEFPTDLSIKSLVEILSTLSSYFSGFRKSISGPDMFGGREISLQIMEVVPEVLSEFETGG